MSSLRALLLLAALPVLVGADEPGVERSRAPRPQGPTTRVVQKAPAGVAPAAVAPEKATTPRATGALRVFRFDALRVDGLAGPNALVFHDLHRTRRSSLVQRRRSFLHRMLEAVEVGPRGKP
ncbi:MAG: hypothetical protein JRH20_11820 [Deltaproteobacteria bacterium]|nr:hypothetical protein [Deltaproteobacteria bacterium]